MAKKIKRITRKKTSRERENIGVSIEKRAKDFAEEVENLGRRVGLQAEKKGREWEREQCCLGVFGFIGPVVSSIIGVLFLALGIWLLNFINIGVGSIFISAISNFLYENLHWFFIAFLVFGYGDYLYRRFPKIYWTVSPIVNGAKAFFVIWIFLWIFDLINFYAVNRVIEIVSTFLYMNIQEIFILVVALGYIIMLFEKFEKHPGR